MKHMLKTTIVALAIAITPLALAQEGDKIFKAGASMSNITPWMGTSLAGSMRDRTTDRVHDDTYVRSLVMDDGTTTLSISLVDTCMVERPIMDSAKARASAATGIPVTNMLVAATHTHSGGTCAHIFQSDADPEYTTFVIRRIADGITRAWQNRVPAKIGWGSGSVPDEVFNRRWYMKEGTVSADPFGKKNDKVKMNPPRASENLIEPAGPIDPEVAILALETVEGKPLALLANYSLHYVGGVAGASGDYFGVFANRIAQLLKSDGQGHPFVAMMSNGTSGDINNVNFAIPRKKQGPGEQMTLVGNKVAAEVHRAYADIEFQNWVPLASAQKEITLGIRKPSADEVVEAREILAKAKSEKRVLKGPREYYANCTVDLAGYPDTENLILQSLQIGDLGIGAIPCEVFVEIGLAIKAQTPFKKSFTISLANGYNGYLPTEDQHALGGYETWRAKSSHLEVKAANVIQATVLELLHDLK
jgi:neutral ceramidase